jgi:hypothetical protein
MVDAHTCDWRVILCSDFISCASPVMTWHQITKLLTIVYIRWKHFFFLCKFCLLLIPPSLRHLSYATSTHFKLSGCGAVPGLFASHKIFSYSQAINDFSWLFHLFWTALLSFVILSWHPRGMGPRRKNDMLCTSLSTTLQNNASLWYTHYKEHAVSTGTSYVFWPVKTCFAVTLH